MEKSLSKTLKIAILSIVLAVLTIGGCTMIILQNTVPVEWLSYSDQDITFQYPKTFIKTDWQEKDDKNADHEFWEVSRNENAINITPNFDPMRAQFGSSYQIKIYKNWKEANEEWEKVAQFTSDKGRLIPTTNQNYYTWSMTGLNFGLGGSPGTIYTLIPGGIDEKGVGKNPEKKHYAIFAYTEMYEKYIVEVLIPSLKENQ